MIIISSKTWSKIEVVKIYFLQGVSKPMIDLHDSLYNKYAKERVFKEAFDRDIYSDALEDVMNSELSSVVPHFITGSRFHFFDHTYPLSLPQLKISK